MTSINHPPWAPPRGAPTATIPRYSGGDLRFPDHLRRHDPVDVVMSFHSHRTAVDEILGVGSGFVDLGSKKRKSCWVSLKYDILRTKKGNHVGSPKTIYRNVEVWRVNDRQDRVRRVASNIKLSGESHVYFFCWDRYGVIHIPRTTLIHCGAKAPFSSQFLGPVVRY